MCIFVKSAPGVACLGSFLLAVMAYLAPVCAATHRHPVITPEPVCLACPAVSRPDEPVYFSFELTPPPGGARLVLQWGDHTPPERSGWYRQASELRFNHRYARPGRYTLEIWQESARGVRSNVLMHTLELAPPPVGPEPVALPRVRNSLGMEFVWIPAGSFVMGSPNTEAERYDNETPHRVTLTHSYYLQTTEVTQAQWQAVMGTTLVQQRDKADPRGALFGVGARHPIYYVSWNEIQLFIERLNRHGEGRYRLPTEAEWEYAARAGSDTPFSIGNGHDLDSRQANFDGNYPHGAGPTGVYRAQTTPVKHFAPNAWGLYDMHGNVWEWVQDRYGAYPDTPVVDPQGPAVGEERVLRGGTWRHEARHCRSARRGIFIAGDGLHELGFRLLRAP